jgi:hypothetical protein
MIWRVPLLAGDAQVFRPHDTELDAEGVGMAFDWIDDDDVPAVWVGTYGDEFEAPVLYAVAGADGRILHAWGRTNKEVCGLDPNPRAASVAAVDDVDGDLVGDVLVGTGTSFALNQGTAFLVSGKTGKTIFGLIRKGDGVRVVRP